MSWQNILSRILVLALIGSPLYACGGGDESEAAPLGAPEGEGSDANDRKGGRDADGDDPSPDDDDSTSGATTGGATSGAATSGGTTSGGTTSGGTTGQGPDINGCEPASAEVLTSATEVK